MAKRGPKTEEGKAKSLANLAAHKRPNWKPGECPNPAGRPNAGLSIEEWFNIMPGWTLAQLKRCAEDPNEPSDKVVAARQWIQAREGNGNSVDRLFDRTKGKPKNDDSDGGPGVTVNVTQLSRDELVRIVSSGRRGVAEA